MAFANPTRRKAEKSRLIQKILIEHVLNVKSEISKNPE